MSRTHLRFPRRGVAMLLVLGVVAIASVLGWAMLSATAARAKVEAITSDSLEAAYQADSGVSYALYYLRYPGKSSGQLTYKFPHKNHFHEYDTKKSDAEAGDPDAKYDPASDPFTATQTGLRMWSDARGTTDVSVTSAGGGLFSIRSTSTVAGLTRTTIADCAYTYDRYAVTHALALNNTSLFSMPAKMSVNGPVVTRGLLLSLYGGISNSPTVVPAGKNVTPAFSELALADEISSAPGSPSNDRPYTFDGITYYAERVSSPIIGELKSNHPLTNPKNVWYATSNVTMNAARLNGTLVMLDGKTLTSTGETTITAQAEMPALICSGKLDVKSSGATPKLTIYGVAWVGGEITDGGPVPSSASLLQINGALLMGDTGPKIDTLKFKGTLNVVYVPSVATNAPLSKIKTINGVAVRGWRSDSN